MVDGMHLSPMSTFQLPSHLTAAATTRKPAPLLALRAMLSMGVQNAMDNMDNGLCLKIASKR